MSELFDRIRIAWAKAGPGAPALIGSDGTRSIGDFLNDVRLFAEMYDKAACAEDVLMLPVLNTSAEVAAILAAAVTRKLIYPIDARDEAAYKKSVDDFLTLFGDNVLIVNADTRTHSRGVETIQKTGPVIRRSDLPASAFVLQRTSGSTGRPRLSVHSETNIVRGIDIYRDIWRLTPDDRILVPLSLSHSFGMIGGVFASLGAGATTLIMKSSDAVAVIGAAENHGATIMLGSPEYYRILCTLAPAFSASAFEFRLCLSSGEPMDSDTAAHVKRFLGAPVAQVYGSTETGIIAATWPDPDAFDVRCVGRVVPGTRARAVNDGDVASGNIGVIEVLVPTLHLAYVDFGLGEIVAVKGPSWRMADRGTVDDEGLIFLAGRESGFINIGGEKINSYDVGMYLRSHSLVADAHVYSKAMGNGREIMAALIYSTDKEKDEGMVDVLRQYCRDGLGANSVPTEIHIVRKPFREETGKISHENLR